MSEPKEQTPNHEPPLPTPPAYPALPAYPAPTGGAPQYPGYVPPVPQSGKATAVLVLGILGLVFVWCYVIPGLVMGIIALALSVGARREIAQSGGRLRGEGFLKSGVICAWISVGLGVALIILVVIAMLVSVITGS